MLKGFQAKHILEGFQDFNVKVKALAVLYVPHSLDSGRVQGFGIT